MGRNCPGHCMCNLEACYIVNCYSKSGDFLPPLCSKNTDESTGKKTKNNQLNNASDGNKIILVAIKVS